MVKRLMNKVFTKAESNQWDRIYWAFDLHETIIKPNWTREELPLNFYPYAKEALQMISNNPMVVMIMYTCSHPFEISRYLEFFEHHDIHFNYVNENPEVSNQRYGCYDKKPYFNLLFEDKAGFEAENDWKIVIESLNEIDFNFSADKLTSGN